MSSQNKIIYEHLKDYPTSSECFHDIGNRAIPGAWAHKPEIAEASPEKRPQSAVRMDRNKLQSASWPTLLVTAEVVDGAGGEPENKRRVLKLREYVCALRRAVGRGCPPPLRQSYGPPSCYPVPALR
jgi:hypothetical protein